MEETKGTKRMQGMQGMTAGQVKKLLQRVCRAFRIPGELQTFETILRGNINTTYRVFFFDPDGERNALRKSYLLQGINAYVFKNPEEIMQNIDRVTTHIRRKSPDTVQLHFHHTAEGKNYYRTDEGTFWRLCNYIDAVTFNNCSDLLILRNTGKAFGRFQMLLSDFDAGSLRETIPDFHNTEKRLEDLFAHAGADPLGRAAGVREELAVIASMRERVTLLCRRQREGSLPLRVTHNDTKVNNVLFHKETLEPLVVIDLDTVMPGLSVYDFGDAVRFAAASCEEDETDLSKVFLDPEKFRALTEGYLGAAKDGLLPCEAEHMALGALTLTVELAARFLDDYLTGDSYFRTRYPGHNLVRARCQLALAGDMSRKFAQMEAIVAETARREGIL